MKKVIAILLVVLVAGVMFADPSPSPSANTELYLKTSVSGLFGVKISADSTEATTKPEFDGIDSAGTSADPIVFTSGTASETLYVHLMTNKNSSYAVKVVGALPLKQSDSEITTEIGYTVAPNGLSSVEVEANDTGEDILLATIGADPGLRFDVNSFTISLTEDDWDAASEGSYATTWTVNLIAN